MKRHCFGPALWACAALLALGGCSTVAADETDSIDPLPVATAVPEDAGQELEPDVQSSGESVEGEEGDVVVAPNGDVVAELGVESGLVGPDGNSAFSMTIREIRLEKECPSKLGDGSTFTAENGSFLVADVAAVMDPEFAEMTSQDTPFLTVDSDAFALLDLNEVSQSDIFTVEAYGCYSNDQRIAPFVNPGESVEGLVVLDTDLEHGYLVYNPWGVEGSGWRWEF